MEVFSELSFLSSIVAVVFFSSAQSQENQCEEHGTRSHHDALQQDPKQDHPSL
jgi:hypothetical protein